MFKNKSLGCLVGLVTLFVQIIILGLFYKYLAGVKENVLFSNMTSNDFWNLEKFFLHPIVMVLLAIAISILSGMVVHSKNKEKSLCQTGEKKESEMNVMKEWEKIYGELENTGGEIMADQKELSTTVKSSTINDEKSNPATKKTLREFRVEFENLFEEALRKKYNKEVIVRENRIGQFIADFSIIDTKTKEILAIFELKTRNREEFSNHQLAGFNSYIQQVSKVLGKDIPFYYVMPAENEAKYSILKLVKTDTSFEFEKTDFPQYDNLKQQQNLISTQLQKLKKEKADEIDWLRNVSWGSSLVIISIFIVFKIFLKIDLTTVDLALILSAAFLVIFPYIKKISYKDLIIEMHKKSLKKDDNET